METCEWCHVRQTKMFTMSSQPDGTIKRGKGDKPFYKCTNPGCPGEPIEKKEEVTKDESNTD